MTRWTARLLMLMVITATVAAFAWLAYVSSRGGQTSPLHSMRRFDPYGVAALAKVLEKRGHEVISLQRPRLEDSHTGALIQVLAMTSTDHATEQAIYVLPVDDLLRWAADGHTIIQLSRQPTALMKRLGVAMAEPDSQAALDLQALEDAQRRGAFPDQLQPAVVEAVWSDPAQRMAPARPVLLRAAGSFTWDDPSRDKTLARPTALAHVIDNPSAVVACQVRHGDGRVIFIASPSPATNQGLGEADNLEAMLGLIPPGAAVLFDEWAHGVGHAGTVMDVIVRFGLLPLIGQIVLLIVLYRWSTAGLPQPQEDTPPRRRSSHEQIDTLGHLYNQTWGHDERIRQVHDEVARRFAAACRCDVARLPDRLRSMHTPAARSAAQLLAQLRGVSATLRPVCRHCGYDLTAAATDHCPECGKLLPRATRRLAHRADLQAAPDDSHPMNRRALARMLTQSHHLSRELSVG